MVIQTKITLSLIPANHRHHLNTYHARKLISFNGAAADGKVKLNWATASETNNDYFTIERSNDAVTFEPVGYVNGAGNSNIMNEYMFYDNAPFALSYYKLKQTDFDGTSTFSEIIAVNTLSNSSHIQITSLENMLYIQPNIKISGVMLVNVYDLNGKLVYLKSIELNRNQNLYVIRPETKASSLYIVSAAIKDYDKYVEKVYLN